MEPAAAKQSGMPNAEEELRSRNKQSRARRVQSSYQSLGPLVATNQRMTSVATLLKVSNAASNNERPRVRTSVTALVSTLYAFP